MNVFSRLAMLGLAAALSVGAALPVSPTAVAAAPAATTADLAIDAPPVSLGFSPDGPVSGTVRVENRGTAAARNVVVRLRLLRSRGVAVELTAAGGPCVSNATASRCVLGDIAVASTAELTIRWRMLTRHYDEAGSAVVVAVADNAGQRTAATGAAAGTDPGPSGYRTAELRVRVPRAMEIRAGNLAVVPVELRAEGDAPAEGVFVMIEVGRRPGGLTLIAPPDSACVRPSGSGLICYLPEVIEPGGTSTTWGLTNPFLVRTRPEDARAAPYELSVFANAAGSWYRNVGRKGVFGQPGDGSWVIRPTVPLTRTVSGNEHTTADAEIAVRLTPVAGPAEPSPGSGATDGGAAGGSVAGLPVTGAPTTTLVIAGALALFIGAGLVVAVRRRRVGAAVD